MRQKRCGRGWEDDPGRRVEGSNAMQSVVGKEKGGERVSLFVGLGLVNKNHPPPALGEPSGYKTAVSHNHAR